MDEYLRGPSTVFTRRAPLFLWLADLTARCLHAPSFSTGSRTFFLPRLETHLPFCYLGHSFVEIYKIVCHEFSNGKFSSNFDHLLQLPFLFVLNIPTAQFTGAESIYVSQKFKTYFSILRAALIR